MDTYDALVARLIADADNEITTPEFNLTGNIRVWFSVVDGKVTGVELRLQSLEVDPDPQMCFAKEAGTHNDGPDLTSEEAQAAFESAVDENGEPVYADDFVIETTD